MANMNREIERTKQTTEEKCKKEYMEEMKKLAAKHKDAISATKKKQWVSSQLNTKMQIYVPGTCSHREKAVGSNYWVLIKNSG